MSCLKNSDFDPKYVCTHFFKILLLCSKNLSDGKIEHAHKIVIGYCCYTVDKMGSQQSYVTMLVLNMELNITSEACLPHPNCGDTEEQK